MLKEIFEQPAVVAETLEGRIYQGRVLEDSFGPDAAALFNRLKAFISSPAAPVLYAGLIARYWLESLGVPCTVEVASEYRYRRGVTPPHTLFVCISQSGETADTLAALGAQGRSGNSCHLQCRRKLTGAGGRVERADSRWPGNRRGFDQGVYDAIGGVAVIGAAAESPL